MKSYPLFPESADVDLNENLGFPTSERLSFSGKAIGATIQIVHREVSTEYSQLDNVAYF